MDREADTFLVPFGFGLITIGVGTMSSVPVLRIQPARDVQPPGTSAEDTDDDADTIILWLPKKQAIARLRETLTKLEEETDWDDVDQEVVDACVEAWMEELDDQSEAL